MSKQLTEMQKTLRQKDNLQRNNTTLRAQIKALQLQSDISDVIREAVTCLGKLKGKRPKTTSRKPTRSESKVELEILLGDLHMGKICEGYSTDIAKQRMEEYADFVCETKKKTQPNKTTLVVMGDLIEHSGKHIYDSRDGCDSATSEQIVNATIALQNFILKTQPDVVVAVAGNHENPAGRGSAYNSMGKIHFTNIIYNLTKSMFPDIQWVIPNGNFATYKIGGRFAVAEHGSEVAPTEAGMTTMLLKRSKQAGKLLDFLRMGDRHQLTSFDGGHLTVNGAFFKDKSGEEYSSVKGYSSRPGQFCVVHSNGGISALLCYNPVKKGK